jgi:hypothetical protein
MNQEEENKKLGLICESWLTARRVRMQLPESAMPNVEGIKEEKRMIEALIRRFPKLEGYHFIQAINRAADIELESGDGWKSLTHIKIKDQLHAISAMILAKQQAETPALPEHNKAKADFEAKYSGTVTEALLRNLEGLAILAETMGTAQSLDVLKDGMEAEARRLLALNGLIQEVVENTRQTFGKQWIAATPPSYHGILQLEFRGPNTYADAYLSRRKAISGAKDESTLDTDIILRSIPDFAAIGRAQALISLWKCHQEQKLRV